MKTFLPKKSSYFYLILLLSSSIQAKTIRDVNVGFPTLADDPVPASQDCICPQQVLGTTTTVWRGAAVEPTIAVNPKKPCHIVAAWQNDRINNGGSLEAGIAYSNDGGQSWARTVVPFQICIGGTNQRVTDVWLSYSADGKVVYLNALLINANLVPGTQKQGGIVVSVSHDNGAHWDTPVFVESTFSYLNEPTGQFESPDKNAITADPNDACKAYTVWDTFVPSTSFHSDTYFSFTSNQGKTFSSPLIIYNPFPDLTATGLSNGIYNDNQTIGNIIVVLPKCKGGTLINFMCRIYATPNATDDDYVNDAFPFQFTLDDVALVRSFNGGVNWETTATIISPMEPNAEVFTGGYNIVAGAIQNGIGTDMRTSNFGFDANVNPKNGNLYAVWQTSRFSPVSTQLPLIALSTSRDGGSTWSTPVKVSQTPSNVPNPQAFTPFVAVTENGFVGVLYTDFRFDPSSNSAQTPSDTWLAIFKEVDNPNGGSTGVGLDFVREVRLSQTSYIAQNGPVTTQGTMTNGDYSFLTTHAKNFYAIYTKSFNGPFTPTIPEFCPEVNLDNNVRQSPFVSIIPAK